MYSLNTMKTALIALLGSMNSLRFPTYAGIVMRLYVSPLCYNKPINPTKEMRNTMNTTITRGEALDVINFAVSQVSSGFDVKDEEIEIITYAVNNDLQIRDYLLGLPSEIGINSAIDFVNYLSRMANDSDTYAYDTISAMYHIELGNTKLAETLLEGSQNSNPEYNLTKLAKRVLSAGWSGNALTQMRNELHGKVSEIIAESSDFVIGEDE